MKRIIAVILLAFLACTLHAFDIVKDGKTVSIHIPEKAILQLKG